MEVKVLAAEILKRPYARVLTPDPDGRVTAEIMEFPGCVAYGDNTTEALAHLEEVAIEWIDAALEQGQEIPEPMDNAEYSGRLGLRMTRGLHKRAAICADREGVSLNQFINTCVAEAVGERARAATLYPIAQIQTVTTTTICAGANGTGVVMGLSDNSANRLSTGTNAGLLRAPTERDRERQYA